MRRDCQYAILKNTFRRKKNRTSPQDFMVYWKCFPCVLLDSALCRTILSTVLFFMVVAISCAFFINSFSVCFTLQMAKCSRNHHRRSYPCDAYRRLYTRRNHPTLMDAERTQEKPAKYLLRLEDEFQAEVQLLATYHQCIRLQDLDLDHQPRCLDLETAFCSYEQKVVLGRWEAPGVFVRASLLVYTDTQRRIS